MKANELRVGNWVNNNEEDYQITSVTILQLERGDSTAKPIPLTDEWLIRFGFENGGYEFLFWNLNGFEISGTSSWFEQGDTIGVYAFNWHSTDKTHNQLIVNYVHQLQNLYFALTSEELTLNHAI